MKSKSMPSNPVLDIKSESEPSQFALLASDRREILPKNFYFDNEAVEHLMHQYVKSACTEVPLRDEVMTHASELIRQIIKAHNLGQIYPGKEESSIMDLFQTAWIQIESALYKYEAFPHCTKCYNPMRPNDSILFDGYAFEEFLIKKIKFCRRCKVKITVEGIYYRGKSRVFNMWCVNPKTKVFTQNGMADIGTCLPDNQSNQIEYGNINNLKVYGLKGMNDATAYIRRPMSKTLIITTAQGYNVEVTPEHEIMVLNEYGIEWVKASNLTLGKLLAIQYQQNCFGNDDSIAYKPDNNNDGWLPPGKWTSALAYLIGLAISEGCITNRGLTICNMEKEVIDFTQASPLGLRFRKEDQVKLICSSTRLVSFLSWLGIGPGCTADKKVIPDKLFRCSTNILRWVLRGMFDGDGHSNKRNGCVGYTSISKTLIEQLRVLLLNFGIVTKISVDHRSESKFTVKGRTYVSKKKPAYQLLLSTTDSRKFYEVIGFNVVRKQENIQNLKSERYFMPSIIMKQVRNLITEAEISRTHIDKITSINNRRNGLQIHNMLKHTSITRDMLEILLCVYQEENTLSYTYLFDRLTESYNTRWLPIISIKESKSPTVDITVPATRSFTANGIIVSNSQIARTVILAYIKKENRDRKNSEVFRTHLEHQVIIENSALGRFFLESRELSKYNSEHLKILQALEKLYKEDDRAHEGLISKLVVRTGLSRATVTDFFRILRSRSHEISDSPVNREVISVKSMMEIKNGGRSDSID